MFLTPRNFFLNDVFDDLIDTKVEKRFKCDIYEKDDNYFIEMDIPGFKKEDVNISCDNGYLTIHVSKEDTKFKEERNYIHQERNTSEYKRSFNIGDANYDDIKASFKDGILTVTVPKQKEVETKKVIEIE